ERAARLSWLLGPHAETHVLLFDGVALLGPVEYFLGLLAETMGDAERAARHLDAAVQRCERLGVTALAERARRARAALRTGPLAAPAAPAAEPVASDRMVFRREGAYWTLVFGGRESRLKNM